MKWRFLGVDHRLKTFSFLLLSGAAAFFLILLIPTHTSAQSTGNNIYIAQSATGSANGADCSDAYAASFFNTASNWVSTPATGKIGPGTTVYVCGTITGTAGTPGILVFQGSGTSSAPITLAFANGAQLSAPYCGALGNEQGCLVMSTVQNPHSYIIVNGGAPCGWTPSGGSEGTCNGSIVNTANGTTLTYQQDSQAIEADDCNNCQIENLGIYNIYVQSGGSTTADPQYQNCIGYSGSNWLINDNAMHDVGWCLFYRMNAGDTNNQIYRNDIWNTPHPMFFATGNVPGAGSNTYIYDNHFHDFGNWDTPSCTYHIEGIHASGPSNAPYPTFSGLYIYNNVFDGDTGECLYFQVFLSPNTNAAGSQSYVNNAAIFNNVMELSGDSSGCITDDGSNNVAYNNTCVGTNADTAYNYFTNWGDLSQNGYTYKFENNAGQGLGHFVSDDTNGTNDSTVTADHNAYALCTSIGGCFNAFIPDGTSVWSTYEGNSDGQELHSIAVLPLNSPTSTLDLSSTYHPLADSPLIGAGANLYSVCSGQPNPGLGALCSDAAGVARPSSGAWDIGAFQYSTSGGSGGGTPPPDTTPPSIPTGLAATAISTSQINLSWSASTDNVGVAGYRVYRNGSLITTTQNLSYSDTGLAAGTNYSYTVAAYDAAGNASAQSSAANATTQSAAASLAITTASLPGATVGVSYSVSLAATGGTSPYTWANLGCTGACNTGLSWYTTGLLSGTPVNAGTSTFTFQVTDATGATASKQFTITVVSAADTIPPTTAITSPANNATVSSTISVTASASDNVGVTSVQFYLDATLQTTDTSAPYTWSWNTAASSNGSHTLETKAYDAAANIGISPTVTITVSNVVTPPTTPTGLSVSGTTTSTVTLAWTASTQGTYGIAGYKIYRCTGTCTPTTQIGTSTLPGGTDTSLAPNTTYTYAVQAYDSQGNVSGMSSAVQGTTKSVADTTPPTVPTGLQVTGTTTSTVSLSWTASTDNVGVAGYKIYRNSTEIGTTTATSFTNTGLNQSTTYSYTVSAYDAAGNNSAQSSAVQGTTKFQDTTPPTVSVTAPANGAMVSSAVTLAANATDNVAVASVQFRVDGTLVGTPITTSPYTFSWNTASVANGSHSVTAIAKDTSNNQTISPAITITVANAPPADTTPPTVPTGLQVTGTTTSTVSLSWTASTDNVGVAGYKIYRGGIQVGTTQTTSFTDTGLTPGTTYQYAISAYDAAGNNSAQSGLVSDLTQALPLLTDTTPPAIAITTPTNNEVVAGTVAIQGTASDNVSVASVWISIDGGGYVSVMATSSWTHSLDTTQLPNGNHTITAEAADPSGNTNSTAIVVNIENSSVSGGGGGSSGGSASEGGGFLGLGGGGTTAPVTGTTTLPVSVGTLPTTSAGLTALLQSLLAELDQLIAQLNKGLVTTFTRNLTVGSEGADVQNLQTFLDDNGYPVATSGAGAAGDVVPYFGAKTAAALAKWQKANGLPATGYFGDLTREKMEGEY